MRKIVIIAALIFVFVYANAQNASVSKVWVADNGDGTYKNPVINADYSDPDVIASAMITTWYLRVLRIFPDYPSSIQKTLSIGPSLVMD